MKKLILAFAIIASLSFLLAIPSIPNYFTGTVEYSVNPATSLEGQQITATVGGYSLGVIGDVQSGNAYEVMIDPQGHSGTIRFFIGGVEATPTATYHQGEFTDLNLEISTLPSGVFCGNDILESGEQCDLTKLGTGTCESAVGISGTYGNLSCTSSCAYDVSLCTVPYCGDAICSSSESCSSCSTDCGACASSGSSGGGGGGGGGGGSSGGSSSRSSSGGGSSTTSSNNNVNVTQPEKESIKYLQNESELESGRNSGITGAVVGFVKSPLGVGLIIGIVIFLVGIGIIILMRK